jgi:hypothetical protein
MELSIPSISTTGESATRNLSRSETIRPTQISANARKSAAPGRPVPTSISRKELWADPAQSKAFRM